MPQNERIYENLSANKQVFVDWLCTPKGEREEKTQSELSEKLNVHRTTLSKWKKRDDVMKAVVERKRELAGVNLIPKVLDAMARRAQKDETKENKPYKDAELLLNWFFNQDFSKGVNVNQSQYQGQSGSNILNELHEEAQEYQDAEDES